MYVDAWKAAFEQAELQGKPVLFNREKTREAQYMLLHTDYTLSDITAILGYSSQSYFTQNFKKYCGRTPQQYRDTGGK